MCTCFNKLHGYLVLTQTLANRTNYVCSYVRSDAILFTFDDKIDNHKICFDAIEGTVPTTQIVILDQPGFQTGGPTTTGFMMLTGAVPLVSAHIQNALDDGGDPQRRPTMSTTPSQWPSLI